MTNVRFFIPWDAFASANSSGCIDYTSSTWTAAQQQDTQTIYFSLLASSATYANLNVMISLSPGQLAIPGDTNQPTATQYECAFSYLLYYVRDVWKFNSFAHEYEVWNEPDEPPSGSNGTGMCSGVAAQYFVDAEITDYYYGGADDLVAGAFGDRAMSRGPDCGGGEFVPGYLNALDNDTVNECINSNYVVCHYETAMSGHPYDDVDNSAQFRSPIQTPYLIQQVNNSSWSYGDPIWLTEAAVWLTDYNSQPACGAGAGFQDVDAIDNGSLAACVDDSPLNQADAAQGWLSLANVTQVARLYYYEFQAGFNFDSALVAPSGQDRPSYCVLAREQPSASACAAAVNDTSQGLPYDQDYQDNPNGTAH